MYTLNVNLKFHGGGNFDIFLPLYALKGLSEVPRGWDFFHIFLPFYTLKVNLKFHGGGNFDIFLPSCTLKVNLKFMGFPKGRHAIIGRACGVAQSGDPRCTSGGAQYGKLRIYNRAGAESQLDIQCIRKGQGVQ